MTEKDNALNDDELEHLFRDSRAQAPVPSDDFMARLAADAVREQMDLPRAVQPPVGQSPETSLWDRVSQWIPRMAWPVGLVTAGLTGVWIGAGSMPVVSDQTQSLFSSDLAYEIAYRVPSLTSYLGGE